MRTIAIILGFVSLGIFGGFLCRGYYRESIETKLEAETRRHLAGLGRSDVGVECNHMFVKLNFEPALAIVEQKEVASSIDHGRDLLGKVDGVYVTTPKVPLAAPAVTLTVGSNKTIVLTGTVADRPTKLAISNAILDLNDGFSIEDRIGVEENIESIKWLHSSKPFLATFLSTPGASTFVAANGGFQITGRVDSEATITSLGKQATDQLGRYGAVANDIIVKGSLPATLSLVPQGKGYLLSGSLPNDENFKYEIVSRVKTSLGVLPFEDRLDLNSDVENPWWRKNVSALIPRLLSATNKKGSLEFGAEHCALTGDVSDVISQSELVGLTNSGLPSDYVFENRLKIKAEVPAELFAYENQDGNLILEGKFQTNAERKKFVGNLTAKFTTGKVIDHIHVTSEVSIVKWNEAEGFIVDLIGKVKGGSLELIGNEAKLRGTTFSSKVKADLREMAALVVGVEGNIVNDIKALAPAVVAPMMNDQPKIEPIVTEKVKQINKIFESQAVYFAPGSTRLNDRDREKIKAISGALMDLDDGTKIIVGGYADQTGDAVSNRRLSLNRANAVLKQLVSLGVPTERLKMKHFGEDTSNLKKSELWKSRRVQLSIGN